MIIKSKYLTTLYYCIRRTISRITYWIDRIMQRPLCSVYTVIIITIVILLIFYAIDCLIHGNRFFNLHNLVKLYGMFSQTHSVYTAEPSEPESFYILLSFLGAITFSGLMISIVTNAFNQRIHRFREGLVSYNFSNHVVIIGGNSSIISVINTINYSFNYHKNKNKKILIVSSKHPSELSYIKNQVKTEVWNKMYFYNCDILLPIREDSFKDYYLNKCRLKDSQSVYIIGDKEPGINDTDNLTIFNYIITYLQLSNKDDETWSKDCYIEYSNLEMLITTIRNYNNKQYRKILEHLRVMPYDLNLLLASKVWGASISPESNFHRLKPGVNGICDIVIVGFNPFAQSMLKMAILTCHFGKNTKTKIKVYYPSKEEGAAELFKINYSLSSLKNIEISFEKYATFEFASQYTEYCKNCTNRPTIVLCDNDMDINIQLAYSIRKQIETSEILIQSSAPLLRSFTNDNTGKYLSAFQVIGNINQAIDIKHIYDFAVLLYIIANLTDTNTNIANKQNKESTPSKDAWNHLITNANSRFFSNSFNNTKWRLLSIIETFYNIFDMNEVKIPDNETIINQYISAVVLSGYNVDDKLFAHFSKAEALKRRVISTTCLNVEKVKSLMVAYNRIMNESSEYNA